MRRSSQAAFVTAVGRVARYRDTNVLQNAISRTPCRCPVLTTQHPRLTTSFIPLRHQSLAPLTRYIEDRHQHPLTLPTASAKPQQEIEWNDIRVISVESACEGHTLLTVSVGITYELGSLTDAYRVPGMFVQLRPVDAEAAGIKPSFFAISSPPTMTGVFEFLIKDAESTAWINALGKDDIIQSTPVMGKGFPLASVSPPPKHVLIFATGAGIAPIRAAIESPLNGVEPKKRTSVTLYYGVRTPERMAYSSRFDAWSDLGVTVIPVVSRPDLSTSSWSGRTGYVQHALQDIGVDDPLNTAVLLCGVKDMAVEVRSLLADAGVPDSNILLNF